MGIFMKIKALVTILVLASQFTYADDAKKNNESILPTKESIASAIDHRVSQRKVKTYQNSDLGAYQTTTDIILGRIKTPNGIILLGKGTDMSDRNGRAVLFFKASSPKDRKLILDAINEVAVLAQPATGSTSFRDITKVVNYAWQSWDSNPQSDAWWSYNSTSGKYTTNENGDKRFIQIDLESLFRMPTNNYVTVAAGVSAPKAANFGGGGARGQLFSSSSADGSMPVPHSAQEMAKIYRKVIDIIAAKATVSKSSLSCNRLLNI
jgi:hypothetical protein